MISPAPISRRHFLATTTALVAASRLPSLPAASRPPRILLRPGTHQRGNIGDIAHSPGALRLFETHFPQAEFTLWPLGISEGARASLQKLFPRVRLVEGELDAQGKPTTPELAAAWVEADLLLHGSAPGFKGSGYMPAWRAASSKPYGIFGMTDDPLSGINGQYPEGATLAGFRRAIDQLPPDSLRAGSRTLLDGAAFIFCRETLTRHYLQRQGVRSPVIEFGPDATFALRLRDDARAEAYLRAQGLTPGRFICTIPRLRYTPYHHLNAKATLSDGDRAKDAVNERTSARDHAKMRDLIVKWVRTTELKVLACPEMSYEVSLAKDMLVDPLPADVKRQVVWRDNYWQPEEAASVYAQSLAVVSFECHSPIIALTNGTPAFYIRQPTDTIKGQMYHDIGVSDWTFEVDESAADRWFAPLQKIHADPAAARARVEQVMAGVARVQRRMVEVARSTVLRAL